MSELVNLPVIDFTPFLAGDEVGQQQVAEAIYQACHEVGFMYLTNHGVEPKAIACAFEQSCAFFALSAAAKQDLAWSDAVSNRGYVGLERERLDQARPGDLKEAFNVGKEAAGAESLALALNRWPSELPMFKETLYSFFEDCAAAATQIFRAFAIALSLPESYLVEQHQAQEFTLRLLHYPALRALPRPGQIRAGAHSDYGTLTLLFQEQVGGLEVQSASGEWLAAPAIADAILVNTGDLMQRWSNDVFRSTRHRVALPQGEAAQRDRYSIAFFCQPDAKAEIACLPSCCSDTPPRYEPITSGTYLLSRLQATY
ncbi:MAG: isopenicillin N synthase family oxygenase [Leptolyngbyaceae cyanobacterium RM1_1_2]|nr:isopenicillin N synthase family oxygenase [Leptolyngbyaceae cyanobacterium RM1_1_2]